MSETRVEEITHRLNAYFTPRPDDVQWLLDERARYRAALEQMLDPSWWREEVDVNGEYTTTKARGYYDVVGDLREILET